MIFNSYYCLTCLSKKKTGFTIHGHTPRAIPCFQCLKHKAMWLSFAFLGERAHAKSRGLMVLKLGIIVHAGELHDGQDRDDGITGRYILVYIRLYNQPVVGSAFSPARQVRRSAELLCDAAKPKSDKIHPFLIYYHQSNLVSTKGYSFKSG